ncbi:DUF6612 family protein [Viridibacillus sp. FSL R5-0477]|uniref:Lipoprotein n=1 Tax=Viridibacillus arenosi FSL R5-213 TaxID=1227360 RepID=W4F472_9BACL|nr:MULTISPECIES: DUF6612 family protein [Viridibacillus]ETT86856.1 hypothetical protein C176_09087 [Viridibacillus arenosi FSL R5-213]OMC83193.1 hypothetical protein BK128_18915 [Viridibacillus sp. FSL H7-0596]OMC83295.1 hypothetical protein BK130_07015 [Viridibacillus sp. FSL H8-0123]OMC88205.1 hypothetical protein BK137_19250 [Viridibacillus arenosi]
MKKWFLPFVMLLVVGVLGACNANEKVGDSDVTAKELYEKTLKQQESLKSYSANGDIKQSMVFKDGEEEMSIDLVSDMKMDIIADPLSSYFTSTTKMQDVGAEEAMDIKMEGYMTDKGFYMKESTVNQWMKMPKEQYDLVLGSYKEQSDPSEQLKKLSEFVEDFKVDTEGDKYVLTLKAEGEKFTKFIKTEVEAQLEQMAQGAEKPAIDDMKFDDVEYVIYINKDDYNIEHMKTIMNMTMKVEGNEMKMKTDTDLKLSNFNSVKPITVPKEVTEKAQEM